MKIILKWRWLLFDAIFRKNFTKFSKLFLVGNYFFAKVSIARHFRGNCRHRLSVPQPDFICSHRMKKFCLIALALSISIVNVSAITAILNPNATKPVVIATNQPPLWDSSLSFGLTLTRGNSDTILTDAGFKAHRNNLTNEMTLSLEGTYGEDHSVKNNESLHGIGQYNHLFTDRIYGYTRGDGFHDDIADLTYRFTISPGIGYYFLKDKETMLAIEAGPSCVLEKLDGARENYAAARLAERFQRKWDDHTRIWENVEFLPQFDKGNNFLMNAEVGVEAPLTKRISLSVVLQDNYINLPAPGRLHNDMKLVSGLVYKF